MRKLYFTSICIMFALLVSGQTVLKFETHGLVADHRNEMKITDYTDPGPSGFNAVWDFRGLKLNRDFVGTLNDPNHSKGAAIFTQANTMLEEFGNFFFFHSNESAIEQYGFMTANETTQIVYNKPFVKMRYPFTFGSSFVGSFNGTYFANQKELGNIIGLYAVDGDGMGTLLLPGNMVYENALRVKEVKAFDQTLSNRRYDIETVTYRWYVNGHRFPILVLITNTTTYPDGRNFTSTQAAYNPVALKEGANPLDVEVQLSNATLKTYPNPYQDFINIRFDISQQSQVNLSVYDVNGRLVKVLHNGIDSAGDKLYQFSAKEMQLGAGVYIVKLNVNVKEISRIIIEL